MPSELTANCDVMIDAEPDRVWSALTDSELLGKAFFDTTVESDWREGSPISFSGEFQGKEFHDKGQVMKVAPTHELVYTHWSPLSGTEDTPENYHTVTLHLTPANGGTKLALSQDNVGDEEERKHSEQTWSMMLDSLKKLIEQQR
jgi:uncharacterized protein YndB with AHSA1/START domain